MPKGHNNSADFGEFSFPRDNKYAAFSAPQTQGDVNGDNVINMADVDAFAANWRFEKRLNWTQNAAPQSLVVGDLSTRARGDFNYDGRVNLADWAILNSVNPALGAAAYALIAVVPEPSGAAMLALGLLLGARRDRRGATASVAI